MTIRTMNWMQVEEYLAHDDLCILPLGSAAQHADDGCVAPNEFFRLERFAQGRAAWADLLARLPGELARG